MSARSWISVTQKRALWPRRGEGVAEVLAADDALAQQALVDGGDALAGAVEIDHELLEEGAGEERRLHALDATDALGGVGGALDDALAELAHALRTHEREIDGGGDAPQPLGGAVVVGSGVALVIGGAFERADAEAERAALGRLGEADEEARIFVDETGLVAGGDEAGLAAASRSYACPAAAARRRRGRRRSCRAPPGHRASTGSTPTTASAPLAWARFTMSGAPPSTMPRDGGHLDIDGGGVGRELGGKVLAVDLAGLPVDGDLGHGGERLGEAAHLRQPRAIHAGRYQDLLAAGEAAGHGDGAVGGGAHVVGGRAHHVQADQFADQALIFEDGLQLAVVGIAPAGIGGEELAAAVDLVADRRARSAASSRRRGSSAARRSSCSSRGCPRHACAARAPRRSAAADRAAASASARSEWRRRDRRRWRRRPPRACAGAPPGLYWGCMDECSPRPSAFPPPWHFLLRGSIGPAVAGLSIDVAAASIGTSCRRMVPMVPAIAPLAAAVGRGYDPLQSSVRMHRMQRQGEASCGQGGAWSGGPSARSCRMPS